MLGCSAELAPPSRSKPACAGLVEPDAGVSVDTSHHPNFAATALEGVELCDGADANGKGVYERRAWIVSRLEGSAKTCDARCTRAENTACSNGDGVAPMVPIMALTTTSHRAAAIAS